MNLPRPMKFSASSYSLLLAAALISAGTFLLAAVFLLASAFLLESAAVSAKLPQPPPQRDLVVAMPANFPPQYILDEHGLPGGFAVESMEEIAAHMGRRIRFSVYDSWPQVLDALDRGDVDIIPNLGITDLRRQRFDFSLPVESFALRIFIRSSSTASSLEDLHGKRVAVVANNQAVYLMKAQPRIDARLYYRMSDAMFALLAGEVDAWIYPQPWVMKAAAKAGVQHRIKAVGNPVTEVKRGLAVRKQSPLLGELNKAVKVYLESPAYKRIFKKWHGMHRDYWTVKRVVVLFAVLIGVLLAVVTVGMAVWRYRSLYQINHELKKSVENQSLAQSALLQSEQKYRQLVDMVQEGIWVFNDKGRTMFVNPAMSAMLGYQVDDMIGKYIFDFMDETCAAETRHYFSHLSPVVQQIDCMLIHRNGGQVYTCIRTSSAIGRDGDFHGTVAGVMDITQRRKMEQALRESEAELRTMIEFAPEAIMVYDLTAERFTQVNEIACILFGLSRDELPGRSLETLSPPHQPCGTRSDLLMAEFMRQSLAGRTPIFEWCFVGGDKRTLITEVRMVLLPAQERKYVRFTVTDIQERKQVEDDLKKKNKIFEFLANYNDITYGLTVDAVAKMTLEFLRQELTVAGGFIAILNEAKNSLIIYAGTHEAGSGLDHGAAISLQTPVVAEMMQDKLPRYRVDIAAQNAESEFDDSLLQAGVVSDYLVPLSVEEHCLGVLSITLRQGEQLDETDRRMIRLIAPRLAQSLHNASLFEELGKLNKQVRLLMQSTGEGILGVDKKMRCTFINKAACDMLGYESGDIVGRDVRFLFFNAEENTVGMEQTIIHKTIYEGDSFVSGDEILWHKSGDSIPVQYSSNPVTEKGQIIGAAIVFRNIAETQAMTRKMDFLARHDTLTELYNRREFEVQLQEAIASARHNRAAHVLCYMDLDQFKIVNDTCGHVAGDELLRQLSTQLRLKVRKKDTLARLGGDEFGLLLWQCGLDDARQVLDHIKELVNDFRFVWDGKTFTIGMSVGVTIINDQSDSMVSALREADTACYLAKDSGRNRIHVFQKDDAELSRRFGEMQWVGRIRESMEQGRLRLYGQTFIPTGEALNPATALGTDIYFEFLLRVLDEDSKVLLPGAFLPAAERFDLMAHIDRWVIEHAFRWLAEHSAELPALKLCTVNISGNSLNDEKFMNFVDNSLKEFGIRPSLICFEITENIAIANLSRAALFMNKFKDKGVLFALDDFGSGMSSFAYLKTLPVDFLKIDGNFVKDIVHDPVDFAMVEAINKVGQVMGIKTIAEFVECRDILNEINKIGVDFVQGYGISQPVPVDSLLYNPQKKQVLIGS